MHGEAIKPVAIVMTATITPPPAAPALARNDPAVRLADYCEALKFYLELPSSVVDRVLFIDNSNSDLSEVHAIASASAGDKRVQIIGFDGNDHDPSLGKGYGEFKLLDFGLCQTTLLREDDHFWKVTGRLRVCNIERLIATAPREYSVYCDLRNVPLVGHRLGSNYWMDLRVFSCTLGAYQRLMKGRYPDLRNQGAHRGPEQALFSVIMEARGRERIVPRFAIQPEVAGFNGHSNADYQGGSYRMKTRVRKVARRLAPWLWI